MGNLEHNSVIISHGDVDGMVCAAQLIRHEESKYKLFFSNAKYVNYSLVRILKSSQIPCRIYISDIPANAKSPKLLAALSRKGSELYWIDHHPWENGIKDDIENICKAVVYNESLQTPAGILMGRWLKDEDPYYDQIGKICYAYEKGTDWERNWFLLLSSYIGKSRNEVLERLAFNHDFTEDDLKRIEQKKEDELKAQEILNSKPHTIQTQCNKILAIYDTSENQGVYLGHKVFNHHDVDYCLIRITETKWQLASNPSQKYPMKHLMGEQYINKYRFTVAGRENELLAIESEAKMNNQGSHQCLLGWLCSKL